MTTEATPPTGAPAPAVPVTPPVAAPAVATPPAGDPNNPPWLPGRLAQAQAAVLADLGITDPAKAKEMLAEAQRLADEKKGIADRLTETSSKLTTAQAEASRLLGITTEWAGRQMMALTTEQQAAVKAIAGDDPGAQLKAITALQPTWTAAPLASTTPPATPAVVTPPAPPAGGTAPAPNAPPGTTVSQPNHQEVHAQLAKTNPFAAAQYAVEHLTSVFPEQTT